MPVTIEHELRVLAKESRTPDAVGASAVTVVHIIESEIQQSFENVYSIKQALAPTIPVALATNALTYPQRSGSLDLLTGQQLRLVAVHNIGPAVVNITFRDGANDMDVMTLVPGGREQKYAPSGNLFAAPIDEIELLALTGAADVELLIATQLT